METIEIHIKYIGKPEITISIQPDESVKILKLRALEKLQLSNHPSTCRLLLKGAVLNDFSLIKDLSFSKDRRLHLVVGKFNPSAENEKVWSTLYEHVVKYFKNPESAKKAVEEFKSKFQANVQNINIDHIERILNSGQFRFK
ncbi:Ubiquitin-like protein 4A-A [Thelohanellus kitauei]|uniref:Ubiquitin-like protein 4A-A n=1 Tax=Thelohanellus kitauei TaxID=669202 RepID=A0A0C2NE34_THEKT|nr:Ubiquitin-like protein 4A-A [Thelohanellus kitauei]